ncbi:unnamed protein product [Adineta steineri]|uniref:Adenosine deaminase domain-containing protein n=1 Tax=Adineta steineri TaxID=433720 RepID=A0A819CY32_9BILA|nr:unnamed protein product [Adineta steineri]CAF3819886.1 unnamed protein product [Adineta steineri]
MVDRENNKWQRAASDEEERKTAELLQHLESQEGLYELHTHLLGMGNASFWIEGILADRKKLPTQNDFLQDEYTRRRLGPLVWNTKMRSFIDRDETKDFFDELRKYDDFEQPLKLKPNAEFLRLCPGLFPDKVIQELKHREVMFKNDFSYDVVLSLDNLAKGLGLEEDQPRDMIQSMIEEKLGVYTRKDWQTRKFFKYWIVFNARKQELEIVYGVQAKDLRMLIGGLTPIQQLTDPAQRDARAHIINAFSMMNADGSEPRSVDFHSFRGAFTPEFFPRRFALKDSIYSQRLDLLAFLLRNALHRFSICSPPIKYCEFSIGCGDLSRPWVFDVLSTFAKSKDFRGAFEMLVCTNDFPWLKTFVFEQNIDYRFLAGFNRRISNISNAYSADEPVALLFEVPHYAIHVMLREFYKSDHQRPTNLFSEQVKQLQEMDREATANSHFFDWVVGLDLFGDELGYPYCPFVANEFLQFVYRAREFNPNFGVRIHCAENVPFVSPELSGYRLYAAHMYIVYRCLDFLKKKLKSNIRVGHGIAFDKLLSIKNYKFRKSSVLVAEIQKNAESVFSTIPFEINITSNYYLLGDAIRNVENTKPLSALYKIKVPVVLSTDDDGIWPIDKCALGHQSHHSLAAEYCRAITSCFITERKQLENMVEDAKRFCFISGKQMVKMSTASTDVIKDNHTDSYFPTDVIVHPKVAEILIKRLKLPETSIDSCQCLKYYQNLYNLESALDNRSLWDDSSQTDFEQLARVLLACFYLTHARDFTDFKTEYETLFGSELCEETYNACENVYLHLMNDDPSQGASLQVKVGEEDYLFCSEASDNRKGVPHFVLSTIEKFIIGRTTKATAMGFVSSINLDNPEIDSGFKNIDEKNINAKTNILIYSNTEKHSVFLENKSGKLHINKNPEKRTGPEQEDIECGFYVICPHGSVATVALRFIARHIDKKPIFTSVHNISLRTLVIPFLPLCFGYPASSETESEPERRDRFLNCLSINGTELAKQIDVKKYSICRNLCDSKFNLLRSDVEEDPARLLWSLAVGWNPPLSNGADPYRYPFDKWVKSIVQINSQTLNEKFGSNTWESFVKIVLVDARERAWYWHTISRWCDISS